MSSDLEDGLEVEIDGDDGTSTTTIAPPSPETPTHSYNTRSRARSNSNGNASQPQSATATTTATATTPKAATTTNTPKARHTATATSSSNKKKSSATSSESSKFSSTGPGSTAAPMTSSAETPFDRYLRIYVCEPVLQMVPHSVNPNTISYVNVGVCWLTLALAFEAYRTEHEYQLWSFTCRIFMAITVFISLVLDCLDGMQARRTNRCSKLGETLDHGFDAANAPIMCASLLVAIGPDDYSLAIGLVATSMIYNAQLIIYRHHRIMINGPVNGPEAQMLVSVSHLAFAVFFYLCDRDSYTVQTIVQVFCLISNITQFSNCWFFVKHLTRSFDHSILAPHIRFSVQAGAFALFYLLDTSATLSRSSFVIGCIIIAFRLNGLYVLLTIAKYRTLNIQQFKQAMLTEDLPWYPEVVFGIAVIAIGSYFLPAALFTYVPWLFYLSLVVLNVRDMQLWYDKLT